MCLLIETVSLVRDVASCLYYCALVVHVFTYYFAFNRLGFCLRAFEERLVPVSCESFSTGCPEDHFPKTEIYKCMVFLGIHVSNNI